MMHRYLQLATASITTIRLTPGFPDNKAAALVRQYVNLLRGILSSLKEPITVLGGGGGGSKKVYSAKK